MTATWQERLSLAVAAYELVAAGDRLVPNAQAVDAARLHVVAEIDAALEAGAPESQVDQFLERLAAEAEEVRPPER